MRRLIHALALLIFLGGGALASPPVELAVVSATTSTADTGLSSSGADKLHAGVWSPTVGATYTVLLEQQISSVSGTAPWVTTHTFENCDATGVGTVDGTASKPCILSSLVPLARVRLRVSAWTSGSVHRVIQVVEP